jgi:hypothetical protein
MRSTIAAIILLLAFVAGCRFTTAHMSEVTFARTVDKNSAPVERVTGFTKSDRTLHCCAHVENVPSGTIVKAIWRLTDPQRAQVIDSVEKTIDGDVWVDFTLTTGSPTGFPYSSYAVDLFIDGKMSKTLPFQITPMYARGPVFETSLAAKLDDNYMPVMHTTTFPVLVSKIYAPVFVDFRDGGAEITARWYSRGNGGERDIAVTDIPFGKPTARWMGFSLTPNGTLPAGTYYVDILCNHSRVATHQFTLK